MGFLATCISNVDLSKTENHAADYDKMVQVIDGFFTKTVCLPSSFLCGKLV